MSQSPPPILVTGATGFLGRRLAETLLRQGREVRALGRKLEVGLALDRMGADFRPVDLRDRPAVIEACKGVAAVVHCGALSSAWGRYDEFVDTNVHGTASIVDGCLTHGVGRLVHISSPSVMSRHEPQWNLDESCPLPETFVSLYSETKARGEEVVRRGIDRGLAAVILRPKAIYGPGDQALFPRIVRSLSIGRLPIIGDGNTVTNITHVDDVVQAISLALASPAAVGRTYLITGGEEVRLWDVIALVADRLGYKRPSRRIPVSRAMKIATLLEGLWRLLHLPGEPPLTRYTVSVMAHSQTYVIEAAHRDLGYEPRVRWQEGIDGFLSWLKAPRPASADPRRPAPSPTGAEEQPQGPAPTGGAPLNMLAVTGDHKCKRQNAKCKVQSGQASWLSATIDHRPSTITFDCRSSRSCSDVRIFETGVLVVPAFGFGMAGLTRKVHVPTLFALIRHPRFGPGLFDTGYAPRFGPACGRMPFCFYRMILPPKMTEEEAAAARIRAAGVQPEEIRWIVLSHFDPDHIAGLRDFPNARVICSWRAWEAIRGRQGWSALRRRLIPDLLPEDLAARLRLLPDPAPDGPVIAPLPPSIDLFGDASMLVVPLPGHAHGHIGLLVKDLDERVMLLCGDAVWSVPSLRSGRFGFHRLISEDKLRQEGTYALLRDLLVRFPEWRIVPAHCPAAAQRNAGRLNS